MKKRILMISGIVILLLAVVYHTLPTWVAKLGLSAERFQAGLTRHEVSTATMDYAYLTGGPGSVNAPTLLLIHGFSGDKDNYTRLAKYLTDAYHVVVPDLPGFGESTKDIHLSYDVASQVSRLHSFVQKMDLTTFHLAGHSMGGSIACAYAVAYPDEVESLLLIAPAGVRSAPDSRLFKMLAQGQNPFLINSMSDFDNLMSLVFYETPFIPRPVKHYFAEQSALNRELLEKEVSDLKSDSFTLERQVGRYPGFVLVIWGDHDQVLHPAGAGILANGNAGVEMEMLKNCGHMPILEQPKKTAALYRTFLRKVER